MTSRAYAWLATNGGVWSLASNWSDLTDGIAPSLTVPGAQDSVTVAGASGSVVQTITGQGAVLAASFTGNTALAGAFTFTTLSLGAGGAGGLLDIGAGATLADVSANLVSGSLFATGTGARVTVSGTLAAGQASQSSAQVNLYATAGAAVQAAAASLNGAGVTLYVDTTSSIEIGTAGGAAAGALTIDSGAMLTGQGDANEYGWLVDNGTILASGGTLAVGRTTGLGTLAIAAGAELLLQGATGASQAVLFAGNQATLAWQTEYDAPSGTITGFAAGDAFDVLGSPISAATYKQTGSNLGTLTLSYGGATADALILAGTYANEVFLTAGDGQGGTLIFVVPNVSTSGTASPGTTTKDIYTWAATGSGAWNSAANWTDVTAGQNPAKLAPGVNDAVSIAAPTSGGFAIIAGPANAASLAVTGNLGLAGAFAAGSVILGTSQTAATLDLLPNGGLTTQNLALVNGGLTVTGAATLSVAGTLALGGGAIGVGLPVTALTASAGAAITAGTLSLGGGAGDSVTTDTVSSIEIGTAHAQTAGTVTIDPGAQLSGNGSVNPFGNIVDNGTITAQGGALVLGTVTGSGVLDIGANAGLLLDAGTANAIGFTGAGATLALADERIQLTGAITGFAPGDVIDIENDQITAVTTGSSGSLTTLFLYYDGTLVGRFSLSGSYGSDKFVLTTDGANGTDIQVTTGSGGGGNTGQGSTDTLAWASPGSGTWSRAANWYDVTTGKPATASPGTQNTVELIGPTGGNVQTVAGPAACTALGVWGNSLLNGAFSAVSVTIGGTLAAAPTTTGEVSLAAAATLNATSITLQDGGIQADGTGAAVNVSGTLTLGIGASGSGTATTLLSVANHATAQLAALTLGGGAADALVTDATGSIEVGTLGDATAGAVTIDAGITVSGNGTINLAGNVIDNGTLTAQGGTLTLGTLTGSGTLAIGAEATLALAAADACPILFGGAGATLLLANPSLPPSAPITGFAQGDFILTGANEISSVVFTPGSGGVGTLTLYYGSQAEGALLLAGSYATAEFNVQQGSSGSAITLQTALTGPSGGTSTPDTYIWTGPASGGAWNSAGNWQDVSAGQSPAAIAPGAQDLVSITAGTQGFASIVGPANAASLSLTGDVALSGQYALGALAIGGASSTGVLAIGAGTAIAAASVMLTGGLQLQQGGLSCTGTLAITNGVAVATAGALLEAASIVLTSQGTLATDSSSAIEIGAANDAAPGTVTVDPGAVLAGAGLVNPTGSIVDNGTITASGGTLALGTLSGSGTLVIDPGAMLDLLGPATSGLTLDFIGAGTLTLAGTPQAAIAGFGGGDVIQLPYAADTALYAQTGAGTGVLTLFAAGQVVGSLTLLGVAQGQSFTLTANAGSQGTGGSVLTTTTVPWNDGGSNMTNGTTGTASSLSQIPGLSSFSQGAQTALADLVTNQEFYLYTSDIGDSVPGAWAPFDQSFADNIALVTVPGAMTEIVLPSAYDALLVAGNNPVILTDGGQGNALIAGNNAPPTVAGGIGLGGDTIVGFGANDTLVGGTAGSVIFAESGDDVIGGGNDVISTGPAACTVTTAQGARSLVFLSTGYTNAAGLSANAVTSQGSDIIVAGGTTTNPGNDIVNADGSDTVFGPEAGQLVFNGGDLSAILVANDGTFIDNGGAGNGSVLWAGTGWTYFNGGAGSAVIVGNSGNLQVAGGTGALTVYGGTGLNQIIGAAGPSRFLVGEGASTVSAAAGNHVWLAGDANCSLVAGNGNILFNGSNSAANNVFDLSGATQGNVTVFGGSGSDTVLAGAGNATVTAGSGADFFMFTNGLTGGSEVIANFNAATDRLDLQGYGGSYSSALVNGSEVITLADGTSITLLGLTSLPTASIVSS